LLQINDAMHASMAIQDGQYIYAMAYTIAGVPVTTYIVPPENPGGNDLVVCIGNNRILLEESNGDSRRHVKAAVGFLKKTGIDCTVVAGSSFVDELHSLGDNQ
jgi:hypothetical protein